MYGIDSGNGYVYGEDETVLNEETSKKGNDGDSSADGEAVVDK